jgi:hypothetical protein
MSSGENGPPPAVLPPNSHYKSIEKDIAKVTKYKDMDTTEFADAVVGAVTVGSAGKIWKGGNMTVVRWLVPIMPSFVYVCRTPIFYQKRLTLLTGSDNDVTRARFG